MGRWFAERKQCPSVKAARYADEHPARPGVQRMGLALTLAREYPPKIRSGVSDQDKRPNLSRHLIARPDFGLTGRGRLSYSALLRPILRRLSLCLVGRRQSASFAHWLFLYVAKVLQGNRLTPCSIH